MAQTVKNLPAMWETWLQFLGWEDPLEEGMATHSVFLPGKSHGQRSLAGYSSWGGKESDTTKRLSPAQHLFKNQVKKSLAGGGRAAGGATSSSQRQWQ